MRERLFSTSPMNFAFGVPFFPKGAWRAACVEPQRRTEPPSLCRARSPGAVTTSCGPRVGAAPTKALQTWEPSSGSSPC